MSENYTMRLDEWKEREKSPLNDSSFFFFPPLFFIISGKRTHGTIYELFLRETFRLSYVFFLSLFLLNKYLSSDPPFFSVPLFLPLFSSRKWAQEKSTHVYTRFEIFLIITVHFVQLCDAHDFHEKTRLGGGRIRWRLTTHWPAAYLL